MLKPPNKASRKSIGIMHPTSDKVRRGHGGGSRRVFGQFAWLEVGTGKVALSRPTHQRVAPRRTHRTCGGCRCRDDVKGTMSQTVGQLLDDL
jgi:hypothetical protein